MLTLKEQVLSLDNSIFIQAEATPQDIQRVLKAIGGFQTTDDINGIKGMIAEGVSLGIFFPPLGDGPARDAGISINFDLFFDNSDSAFLFEWTLNTVRAVVALLHAFPGDLLFMYCSDWPALLRKDGRIILDRDADLWDEGVEPDVLSLIDLPYEWGHIPRS